MVHVHLQEGRRLKFTGLTHPDRSLPVPSNQKGTTGPGGVRGAGPGRGWGAGRPEFLLLGCALAGAPMGAVRGVTLGGVMPATRPDSSGSGLVASTPSWASERKRIR